MAADFKQVSGTEALDAMLEQSRTEPVILFNHDPYCPISARAFEQMAQLNREVMLVDVSREKSLTSHVQDQTNIRHESPQVIILRDGRPTWTASHFAITTSAVLEASSVTV